MFTDMIRNKITLCKWYALLVLGLPPRSWVEKELVVALGTGCYGAGQHGPYTVPRGSLVACNEKARMMRASSEGMMGSHPSELLIHQPTTTR